MYLENVLFHVLDIKDVMCNVIITYLENLMILKFFSQMFGSTWCYEVLKEIFQLK